MKKFGHHGCYQVDLDRDSAGRLLSPAMRLAPYVQTSRMCSPVWGATTSTLSLHTSRAAETAKAQGNIGLASRKRKRPLFDGLPPPDFVYNRTGDPKFNIFDGILLCPELVFHLASHLPSRDLVALYSVSQDFHYMLDTRFTTVCLDQARSKAPESAAIFHFRAYRQFCRPDPAMRLPHPDPSKAKDLHPRLIPSFRWVQFILYREKVIHELFALFAERGVPLPARCSLAMKKMWFLTDMPTNHLRIGAIHNKSIVSDLDLYFATCFYVKLDMICQDPLAPEKRDGLKKLMCGMPDGFTTILKVLKREIWRTSQDYMTAWIRHSMYLSEMDRVEDGDSLDDAVGKDSILGVPIREVGMLQYEHFGKRGRFRSPTRVNLDGSKMKWQLLLRPDQLIMREAIRRGLRFTKHFLRCLLAGYVRPDTLESYQPREAPHRIPEWMGEEYRLTDMVGGVATISIEEGGDPILDSGSVYRGSPYTKVLEDTPNQEVEFRMEQEKSLRHFCGLLEEEVCYERENETP